MTPAAERRFASLIGALTADAAAMGLHWLYDAARIPEVSGGRPEFQEPRAENYHQGGGYFAHPQLEAGDNSQYGESLLAFVRGINAAGEVVHNPQDPGGAYAPITSVEEHDDMLYFGTIKDYGFGRISRPQKPVEEDDA